VIILKLNVWSRALFRRGRRSDHPQTPTSVFLSSERSEGDDYQPWNHLEVAQIGGCNAVAKLQRRNADQQVGERHANALGSILAVDLTGSESYRSGYRMHWQSGHQFVEELPPRGVSFRRVSAGHSVRQFHQRNHRDGDIFAGRADGDFGQSLPGILTLAFCRD
jgi:hypothetical protein